jgi:hypothetical protein
MDDFDAALGPVVVLPEEGAFPMTKELLAALPALIPLFIEERGQCPWPVDLVCLFTAARQTWYSWPASFHHYSLTIPKVS